MLSIIPYDFLKFMKAFYEYVPNMLLSIKKYQWNIPFISSVTL